MGGYDTHSEFGGRRHEKEDDQLGFGHLVFEVPGSFWRSTTGGEIFEGERNLGKRYRFGT